MKMKKIIKTIALVLLILIIFAVCAVFGLNAYVKSVGGKRIVTPEEAAAIKDADCILVLGCSVKIDHTLSDMLEDRLRRGVELYGSGAAPKLLMSGDHGTDDYDERLPCALERIMGQRQLSVRRRQFGIESYGSAHKGCFSEVAKGEIITTQAV